MVTGQLWRARVSIIAQNAPKFFFRFFEPYSAQKKHKRVQQIFPIVSLLLIPNFSSFGDGSICLVCATILCVGMPPNTRKKTTKKGQAKRRREKRDRRKSCSQHFQRHFLKKLGESRFWPNTKKCCPVQALSHEISLTTLRHVFCGFLDSRQTSPVPCHESNG